MRTGRIASEQWRESLRFECRAPFGLYLRSMAPFVTQSILSRTVKTGPIKHVRKAREFLEHLRPAKKLKLTVTSDNINTFTNPATDPCVWECLGSHQHHHRLREPQAILPYPPRWKQLSRASAIVIPLSEMLAYLIGVILNAMMQQRLQKESSARLICDNNVRHELYSWSDKPYQPRLGTDGDDLPMLRNPCCAAFREPRSDASCGMDEPFDVAKGSVSMAVSALSSEENEHSAFLVEPLGGTGLCLDVQGPNIRKAKRNRKEGRKARKKHRTMSRQQNSIHKSSPKGNELHCDLESDNDGGNVAVRLWPEHSQARDLQTHNLHARIRGQAMNRSSFSDRLVRASAMDLDSSNIDRTKSTHGTFPLSNTFCRIEGRDRIASFKPTRTNGDSSNGRGLPLSLGATSGSRRDAPEDMLQKESHHRNSQEEELAISSGLMLNLSRQKKLASEPQAKSGRHSLHPMSPRLDDVRATAQQEGTNSNPIQILCSENFLQTWSDLIADLGSGRWRALNEEGQYENGVPANGAHLQGQRIEILDSQLVDYCGVDIELPGREAIIVHSMTAFESTDNSKPTVLDHARTIAHGKYRRVHVIVCCDTSLTASINRGVASLVTAAEGLSNVFVTVTASTTFSASIASLVCIATRRMNGRTVTIAAAAAHDTNIADMAKFLLLLAPRFTASGALECVQLVYSLAPGVDFLAYILESAAIRNELIRRLQPKSQHTEVSPAALFQLYEQLQCR